MAPSHEKRDGRPAFLQIRKLLSRRKRQGVGALAQPHGKSRSLKSRKSALLERGPKHKGDLPRCSRSPQPSADARKGRDQMLRLLFVPQSLEPHADVPPQRPRPCLRHASDGEFKSSGKHFRSRIID